MDSNEATMDAVDLRAGGDNLLNPLSTTPTASYPPTTLPNPTQDETGASSANDEPDRSETINTNNSSASLGNAGKEAVLGEGSVETNLQDNGDLDTKKLDQTVEDLGSREKYETDADEMASEVPPSLTDASRGIHVDDAEEMGGVAEGGVPEENTKDEEGEMQKQEEDAGFERRDEDGEEDQIPDADDTKESSGKEDPTDDPVNLKRLQRSTLYREGLKLQETPGNTDKALHCYLAAITGLTEIEAFTELPKCLHQISNIYFEKNEYEKAVHFIQAEKMYYETALIDIVNLQKQLESTREEKGDETTAGGERERSPPDGPDSPEIIKAKEYENLAKLCLKESKPQLALEYCGKATKVYQDVYGDKHPTTVGSLDLFTLIYADVGKKLYADAMQKFGVEEKDLEESAGQSPQTEGSDQVTTAEEESTNELRQRSKKDTQQPVSQPSRESDTQPRMEFEPTPQAEDQDDWVTTCLLMLLFFLITVLVLLVMTYFYCLGNDSSSLCHQLKGDLGYWYMKIKHYYLGSGRR